MLPGSLSDLFVRNERKPDLRQFYRFFEENSPLFDEEKRKKCPNSAFSQ